MQEIEFRNLYNETRRELEIKYPNLNFKEWKMVINGRMSKTLGQTRYYDKEFHFSKIYIQKCTEENIKNTVLHEFAHMIAGVGTGHSSVWKEIAKSIGCDGERLNNDREVAINTSKYKVFCPHCNDNSGYVKRRRKNSACRKCCKKYNGGKYSSEYLLEYVEL